MDRRTQTTGRGRSTCQNTYLYAVKSMAVNKDSWHPPCMKSRKVGRVIIRADCKTSFAGKDPEPGTGNVAEALAFKRSWTVVQISPTRCGWPEPVFCIQISTMMD